MAFRNLTEQRLPGDREGRTAATTAEERHIQLLTGVQ